MGWNAWLTGCDRFRARTSTLNSRMLLNSSIDLVRPNHPTRMLPNRATTWKKSRAIVIGASDRPDDTT